MQVYTYYTVTIKRGFWNGYDPHFICQWPITLGRRPIQDCKCKYLQGTREFKIEYDRSSDARLIRYSDLDWGENKYDCHSTSGHIFLIANGAISWASQHQKMIALSVGEAEYMELASTGQQTTWLRSISREIGFPIHRSTPLCLDNQAAIFLTVNPAVKHWTKYIDIWHHYIQKQYKNKVVKPFHIAGVDNPAELFMKSLPVVKVEKFRSKIRLSYNSSVEWECWNRIMWVVFQLTTEHST